MVRLGLQYWEWCFKARKVKEEYLIYILALYNMEEKKTNKQEKLSYEDLQKLAGDLSEQNQKMYHQILQMREALERRDFDYTSFFLSMLFKVMEHPEMYSDDFVTWSSKNIESALMTFAEAASPKEKEEKNEAE